MFFSIKTEAQIKSFQIDSIYTIHTKDTLYIDNMDFYWVFNYHSHKNYENNKGCVLIGDFNFVKNNINENKHVVFDNKPPYYWEWDKYIFTILDYNYDKSMIIKTSFIKK